MEELIKDESKIEESLEALNSSKAKDNKEEIFKSLVLLIQEFENDSDHKSILEVIDEYYDYITSNQDKLFLINKKISSLLKLEEYNELLKTIEIKNEIPDLNDTEKTNILFYKAIALEALDEVNLAIETLESIVDNISRYSFFVKYPPIHISWFPKTK